MKFGICNEIFQAWNDVGRTMDSVKEAGYDGLEIAPFTLADHVRDIGFGVRRDIVRRAEEAELGILGIHWLLVGPDGLYLNHPDGDLRRRTADYLIDLAGFCSDIGGKIMVFGSPKQRDVVEGITYAQAFDYAAETFEAVLPACERAGVTLCMEPLGPMETNFCRTVAETVELVRRMDHPRFRLMLDTKAMVAEEEGRPATIRRYAEYVAHYHANDDNLREPGSGEVDFGPILGALEAIEYGGYVSVEIFKFDADPEAVATNALRYMRQFV